VNSMWNVLHSRWTVVLWVECSVFQWTLCGRYFTAGGQYIVGWMLCVIVNSMWKVLHSRWTVVLWVEYIVLQWTLCGSYCTAGALCYCGLNVVCYREHYVEVNAQQVDNGTVGWMLCVTVNSMWKVLHSRWTVVLWEECCVLQWK